LEERLVEEKDWVCVLPEPNAKIEEKKVDQSHVLGT
jgi:hypothetical protein